MLVNQILLVSDVPRQHISPKHVCQLHMPGQGEKHRVFIDSQHGAVCHRASRGRAGRFTGDGIFANKIPITQYGEDCFLPGFGRNAEFYLSFLNDKYGVCRIISGVNRLPLRERHHLPANANSCEEGFRVERKSLFGHTGTAPFTRALVLDHVNGRRRWPILLTPAFGRAWVRPGFSQL